MPVQAYAVGAGIPVHLWGLLRVEVAKNPATCMLRSELSALHRFSGVPDLQPLVGCLRLILQDCARVVVQSGKSHFQGMGGKCFLHSTNKNTMHSAGCVMCVCVNKVEVIMTLQK